MIPYFRVCGTHYQVGKLIGQRFRDVIVDYYAVDEDFIHVVFPFVQTAAGEKVYNDFLSSVQKLFPQYVEEMRGLADGSGLTFKQVFTMHLSRELRIALEVKKEWGCSDLFINYPQKAQVALGHNEDIDPQVKDRAYVVRVTVYDKDAGEDRTVIEDFTAYAYPGHLPGSAFSFNSCGLIFNCNGLPPRHIGYGKIPRYILNRAMIAANSVEEFERILECDGVGSAYGFSVNACWINEGKVNMWNYETAPVEDRPSTAWNRVSVGTLEDAQCHHAGHYFHCNKYEHLEADQLERLTRSSRGRMSRFSEMTVPQTIDDVIRVLEDETREDYPIFRTPRPTDRNATVCMAIYDFIAMRVDIYEDKPSRCKPDLSLKLPSGDRLQLGVDATGS